MANTRNGTSELTNESLAEDAARLETLISQSELTSGDETDVAELLKHLESADGMAGNLEIKLDGILEKLDGMLQSLSNDRQKSADDPVVNSTKQEAGESN